MASGLVMSVPFFTTFVTKLKSTFTSHMVTPFIFLDVKMTFNTHFKLAIYDNTKYIRIHPKLFTSHICMFIITTLQTNSKIAKRTHNCFFKSIRVKLYYFLTPCIYAYHRFRYCLLVALN